MASIKLRDGDNDSVYLADSVPLIFGSGVDINDAAAGDVQWQWDGTDFDITMTTADSSMKWGTSGAGIDHVFYGDTATYDMTWDQSADTLLFNDNAKLVLGTGSDVTFNFDGTDLDVTAGTDNLVIKFGAAGNSFDIWAYGSIADSYLLWDTSAEMLALVGAARARGLNAMSDRFELKWVAGANGTPGINADILNATESVRMIADPDFEILGSNHSSDDVTLHVEGGIKVETDGADGDFVVILPHLDSGQTAWSATTWGTDQETVWEAHIKTGSAITTSAIWAGLKLTNTSVTATDADQCFFRYEDDVQSGVWECVTSISNSDTETASSVTVAVDTEYHLKIVIGSDRVAKFYINGVLEDTSSAMTDTIDLIPYIGIEEDGASSAMHMYVYGQSISRNYA